MDKKKDRQTAIAFLFSFVLVTWLAFDVFGCNGSEEQAERNRASALPPAKEEMYVPEPEESTEKDPGRIRAEGLLTYTEAMDTSDPLPTETEVMDGLTVQIENHLGDRPLAAYAGEIARACEETGMDPYWFCTISITESGGGEHCFLPYNAWGYGDYAWSSWEEAIPAFAGMFVSGYGAGLDASSHWRYCPSGAYSPYV